MPSILNNVTAIAASRQLGVTQMGLKQAIERLTTGKRVNRASDDAAGMSAGNTAEASARSAAGAVKIAQVDYFQAQAADGYLEEATNLSYRLAELEGSGNGSTSEATAVKALINNAETQYVAAFGLIGDKNGKSVTAAATPASSTAALTTISTARQDLASIMANSNSQATISGITSENQHSISDTWLGADIGAEMVNLTKYQIMMQAGTSALTNANQSSQTVLGLFR
jgi:flagellin